MLHKYNLWDFEWLSQAWKKSQTFPSGIFMEQYFPQKIARIEVTKKWDKIIFSPIFPHGFPTFKPHLINREINSMMNFPILGTAELEIEVITFWFVGIQATKFPRVQNVPEHSLHRLPFPPLPILTQEGSYNAVTIWEIVAI